MATPLRCRLCLVTPPELASGGLEPAAFAKAFAAALSGGDVASVLLRTAGGEEERLRAAIAALCPPAQAAGAAFLVEGRVDLVLELGCDGVQVPANPGTLRAVRRALGSDLILGADCGDSRHSAMVAGELESDFVVFDAREQDTLAWWAELMEVPCVAWGGIELESAPAVIETGADFLAVGHAVWHHPKGPKAAVRAFNALLSELG